MKSWQWMSLHYCAAVLVGMMLQDRNWLWIPMTILTAVLNHCGLSACSDETCKRLSRYTDTMLQVTMAYWRERVAEDE